MQSCLLHVLMSSSKELHVNRFLHISRLITASLIIALSMLFAFQVKAANYLLSLCFQMKIKFASQHVILLLHAGLLICFQLKAAFLSVFILFYILYFKIKAAV